MQSRAPFQWRELPGDAMGQAGMPGSARLGKFCVDNCVILCVVSHICCFSYASILWFVAFAFYNYVSVPKEKKWIGSIWVIAQTENVLVTYHSCNYCLLNAG